MLDTPNIKKPEVTIIDTENWNVIKRNPTKGPGFFMCSHEQSPYVWVEVFFGPNKELVHVIGSRRSIVKTLRPVPVEDGRLKLDYNKILNRFINNGI